MRESYREDLASCSGPKSYAGCGNTAGVATAGEHAGQLLSSDIKRSVCRPCDGFGKATRQASILARRTMARRSRKIWACVETFSARTGRSGEFPSRVARNGQRTLLAVRLTRTLPLSRTGSKYLRSRRTIRRFPPRRSRWREGAWPTGTSRSPPLTGFRAEGKRPGPSNFGCHSIGWPWLPVGSAVVVFAITMRRFNRNYEILLRFRSSGKPGRSTDELLDERF